MFNDLPPTDLVVTLIEQAMQAAREAARRSGDVSRVDASVLDELGRILARCMIRDAVAAREVLRG